MSAGVKGTKGVDFNMTLPAPILARINTRADATYQSRNELLRRFIIENIDVLAPEVAA